MLYFILYENSGENRKRQRGESDMENTPWWKQRVIYQIYPMSFKDSNGDGVGDLRGIIEKLDYIHDLGAGAIWLSPVYDSPMEDNGYDIRDYYSVNPLFGTMQDMEELISEAHRRDLRIIMDLVLNHTSNQHEWFRKSVEGIEPYNDFYIWKPPVNGKKPNNWNGFFGGDVWEYVPARGAYYLHLFGKGQPDLNYRNPLLLDEIRKMLKFWLDKGVDGFRCDVINILFKESFENGRLGLPRGLEHYRSTRGNHRILQDLQETVFRPYHAFTVGESVLVTPEEANDFVAGEERELDQIFYFDHLCSNQIVVKWFRKKFVPAVFQEQIVKWMKTVDWNANSLESHDQPRSVSCIGNDGRYLSSSAKMLGMLLLSLKGTPYLYQGEEIGMTNYPFRIPEDVRDLEAFNALRIAKKIGIPAHVRQKMIWSVSRDNARTPVQWDSSPNAGFSQNAPWIPVNPNYDTVNINNQIKDEYSVLNFYKRMIALRNTDEVLRLGDFQLNSCGEVFDFRRSLSGSTYRILLNFTEKTQQKSNVEGIILISTLGDHKGPVGILSPFEGLIIKETVYHEKM